MTSEMPLLTTERLILRPFTIADAADVQQLAGDPAIAAMTLNIPHPYPDGAAEQWIATHAETWESGLGITLAIAERDSGQLMGAISIMNIRRDHQRGEIGYWVGKPYWNQGYASEATRALIRFGFQELELNRIQATHLPHNLASGRVMEKAGMQFEGQLRQYVKKGDQYQDLCMRSILRQDEGWAQSGGGTMQVEEIGAA